ncbi:MAG: hypothetical protein G01um101431_955 [Parcubacteria group bacterium Gr01-1014_31]|nr:MAG: hypothetical protein G01um101431_955 [Parcubacteria group bacterium Gr01-1014_31]
MPINPLLINFLCRVEKTIFLVLINFGIKAVNSHFATPKPDFCYFLFYWTFLDFRLPTQAFWKRHNCFRMHF